MEKFFEKKNLGIPATLLVLIAYFIGYYISNNLGGLLVAVLFGAIVFTFDFDEKVKTAVKQSYVVGLIFTLIYMFVGVLYQFIDIINTLIGSNDPYHIQTFFNNAYTIIYNILNVVVVIVFALLIMASFSNKEVKMNFVLGILDRTQKQNSTVYQQSVQQAPQGFQQQVPPTYQQPVQGNACPKCGTMNKPGAAFCGSCGNKLQ